MEIMMSDFMRGILTAIISFLGCMCFVALLIVFYHAIIRKP